MGPVFDLAERYVAQLMALDPLLATWRGIKGHDDEMTDWSPKGIARRRALDSTTLAALDQAVPDSEPERIARDVMTYRLSAKAALAANDEEFAPLNTLFFTAPHVRITHSLGLMPRTSEQDWQNVATRLATVPAGLQGLRATLLDGLSRGHGSSRRQAEACADQSTTWGGTGAGDSFFHNLISAYPTAGALATGLETGAAAAAAAYLDFAHFLRTEYAPTSAQPDGVGRERYAAWVRDQNGCSLDFEETYAWGWQELHRIQDEMSATAARIQPGVEVEEVIRGLHADRTTQIEGVQAYREWLQSVHDETLADLDGKHFEVPPPIRRIDVVIPPAGSALTPSYSGPSQDLSRPGRTNWPVGDQTSFSTWDKYTTIYHEGVPGHHLEIGGARCLTDRLSLFQRTQVTLGFSEGWALYAERLMAELGYFERPERYLGMLIAQAARAVRVIVDIGLHLGLAIPAGETFHPGETWNFDLAVEFLGAQTGRRPEVMASEITRYLGNPAQAITYKVGEREWLSARSEAAKTAGSSFDLKRFHTAALGLGPMPLEMLLPEVQRAYVSLESD